jgi:acetyl esterase/lipase
VICPGGGYGGHAIEPEGHGIAKWLNGHGVTGLVLQYRLPAGRSEVPLLDVQRAIRTVRANAESWGLDPKRLGIIGFSAGGHLAASASTLFDNGHADSEDAIEKQSSRPDFSILIYPVISMGELGHGGSRKNLLGESPTEELIRRFSCDQQVTAETPPAFLAHAVDDKVVVLANSRVYHDAQLRHGVASMLLELPSGGHGLNRYQGPMWDAWQGASLKFLEGQFGKPLMD